MSADLFGVGGREAAKKAAPLPDGAMHRLIMLWVTLFSAKFGEKPELTPADAMALKRLAKERGVDVVARRLGAYILLHEDTFEAKEGFPLSLLPRAWNKLIIQDKSQPSRVPDADQTARYLRDIKGGRG